MIRKFLRSYRRACEFYLRQEELYPPLRDIIDRERVESTNKGGMETMRCEIGNLKKINEIIRQRDREGQDKEIEPNRKGWRKLLKKRIKALVLLVIPDEHPKKRNPSNQGDVTLGCSQMKRRI